MVPFSVNEAKGLYPPESGRGPDQHAVLVGAGTGQVVAAKLNLEGPGGGRRAQKGEVVVGRPVGRAAAVGCQVVHPR